MMVGYGARQYESVEDYENLLSDYGPGATCETVGLQVQFPRTNMYSVQST
jgi:hypothetical protein